MASRTPVTSVYAVEQDEGVGARVRRTIGGMKLRHMTPFLMLDHFRAGEQGGFPSHPHRGQTTLTVVINGAIDHEDSNGNKGRLNKGDIQIMNAGRGIAHSEMPIHDPALGPCEGMQLWLDLPTASKKMAPTYFDLKAEAIPKAHPTEDVEIAVVAGKSQGSSTEGLVSAPHRAPAAHEYYNVQLKKAGASIFQPLTPGWTAFCYILSGDVKIGGKVCTKHHTEVLSNEPGQSGVQLEAISDFVRMIVVAGEPLDQPIFQHGPFVVQSREEAIQSIRDFQTGTNGFEGAAAWLASRS